MSDWSLSLVTGPSAYPISLAEAKAHLRVDGDEEDAQIDALIAAATAEIDGKNGWLGRALCTQTWKFTLPEFPYGGIRLPLAPLRSITALKYYDTSGTLQTWDASNYQVLTDLEPGIVEPVYGVWWPAVRCRRDAVQITYVCGYGAPGDVLEVIRAWMKLRVGLLYNSREADAGGDVKPWVDRMLQSCRVLSVYP